MKQNKLKLATIKYKALQLRNNKQLPLYLAKLINDLDNNCDVKYVQFLMLMTQHFLRIRNYYKKFPEAELEAERIIKDGLSNMGYSVN